VNVQVLEGKLVEALKGDAGGMDRRAFGEFVGPGGELASYAFGWTTGSDQHVARLPVGIGAGNPGGGTLHAVDEDPTLMDVLGLPPGGRAERADIGSPWLS